MKEIMSLNDLMFGLLAMTFIVIIWSMMFFTFDSEILNGYFKKKLQNHFSVEKINE